MSLNRYTTLSYLQKYFDTLSGRINLVFEKIYPEKTFTTGSTTNMTNDMTDWWQMIVTKKSVEVKVWC